MLICRRDQTIKIYCLNLQVLCDRANEGERNLDLTINLNDHRRIRLILLQLFSST